MKLFLFFCFFSFSNSYFYENITFLYENSFKSKEGTYNTLVNQYGFCKMQSSFTKSRKTSLGPSLYTRGKVQFGVGLSSFYFGNKINKEGKETCGMCLNITKIQNFPFFSNDLTQYKKDLEIETPFLVMVFDQCKDLICEQEGFLDFDIYSPIPSTNIKLMEWKGIECPTDEEDTIELLFCSSNSCNIHNQYTENILWKDIIDIYFITIIPRNMKIPIKNIKIWNKKKYQYEELNYISGIGWSLPFLFPIRGYLNLILISYRENEIYITISIEELFYTPILLEYNGGIIYNTKKQF